MMLPDVLPMRPPAVSVSEPFCVMVTPTVPVRFSVLNVLADVTVLWLPVGKTFNVKSNPAIQDLHWCTRCTRRYSPPCRWRTAQSVPPTVA